MKKRILATGLTAFALMVFGADFARAEFSSRCVETDIPIEILICNDGVLWRLDARLNEIWPIALKKAASGAARLREGQRAWLRQRLVACKIPDTPNTGMTEQDVWRAAPCLAEAYRARLAALGFAEATPPNPSRGRNFIHPLCFRDMTTREETPKAACNLGYRHFFTDRDRQGFWVAATRTDGDAESIGLFHAGRLYDGQDIYLLRRDRHTLGVSSELYEMRESQGQMQVKPFGDYDGARCNGLVERLQILDKGEFLRIERWVTPKGLMQALAPALDDVGLSDAPWSCIGRLRIRHNARTGQMRIEDFLREGTNAFGDEADDKKAQACFDRLLASESEAKPWSLADLRRFAQAVEKSCIKS